MKYLTNKNGFLGIDNKFNFKEKVVIVPFGLEKTVSYGGGTKNGPKEIIKASHQVELYDEELNCEPYKKIGIKTLKPFPIKKNIEDALKQIENINNPVGYYRTLLKSHLEGGFVPAKAIQIQKDREVRNRNSLAIERSRQLAEDRVQLQIKEHMENQK